jgi:hypothetical protein
VAITKAATLKTATNMLRCSNGFLSLPFEDKRKIYRVITVLIKMGVFNDHI